MSRNKKLFEITLIASKQFYVEARSEEEARESDVVSNESGSFGNEIPWEHDETRVEEIGKSQADYLREHQAKLILKEEE